MAQIRRVREAVTEIENGPLLRATLGLERLRMASVTDNLQRDAVQVEINRIADDVNAVRQRLRELAQRGI